MRAGNIFFIPPQFLFDPVNGKFPPPAPTLRNPFSGFILPGAGAAGINIIDNNLQNPMVQQVNLGMIGGGTVGSGVFHALQINGGLMASRIGVNVAVRKIAVKALDEPRPYEIPDPYMTTEWHPVVHDPQGFHDQLVDKSTSVDNLVLAER